MKCKNALIYVFYFFPEVLLLIITSCIQQELPNAECDILSASLPDITLVSPTIIENDSVTYTIASSTNLTELAPQFTLTEGATINPISGTIRDFSSGALTYVTTAQDRQWSKTYTIYINNPVLFNSFNFEHYQLINNKYYAFYEVTDNENYFIWGSGNAGFSLSKPFAKATEYPTYPGEGFFNSSAAYLVTRSTGSLGALAKMPIAAGNLFTGTFDISNAMSAPLTATQFGIVFPAIPKTLTGYYKYTPGSSVINKDGAVLSGITDQCDIYAVYYLTDSNTSYLTGNNILSSPNIIAVAKATSDNQLAATSDIKQFSFDFNYSYNPSNPSINLDTPNIVNSVYLQNLSYNIAIIFTSSKNGASFTGAVGSTLIVDGVQIICEQ